MLEVAMERDRGAGACGTGSLACTSWRVGAMQRCISVKNLPARVRQHRNDQVEGFTPTCATWHGRSDIETHAAYWHASQYSGFSSEQNTALVASSALGAPGAGGSVAVAPAPTVALAIFVAGRERR